MSRWLDGNGSTFTSTSNGAVTKSVDPNWLVLRGSNITLQNMTTVGDFTAYEGQPRSLATIGTGDPEFTEAQMGYGLYGVDGAKLLNVRALNHWGDGMTTGPAHYADAAHKGSESFTNNVVVDRMTVETVGRHCFAIASGENITIQNSRCTDAWYGGLDAELDNLTQPLAGQRYLNNTFDGYNMLGIFVPVAGEGGTTRDIEIKGNVFLTPPDSECNIIIGVGGYAESNPNTFGNVVIEGNDIRVSHAIAIAVDHINGGSVTANQIGIQDNKGCGHPNAVEPVRVTNSTGMVVENNGRPSPTIVAPTTTDATTIPTTRSP